MPGAALTAVATVGGALISKSASDKASKAATNAAAADNALQSRIFDTTNANYAPYRDLGSWAIPQLQRNMTSNFVPTNAFRQPQRGPGATILPSPPPAAAPTGAPELVTAGGGPGGSRPPGASTAKAGGGMVVDPASVGPNGFGPTAANDAAYRAAVSPNGQTNGQNVDSAVSLVGGGAPPPGYGANAFAPPVAPPGQFDAGTGGGPTTTSPGGGYGGYLNANPDLSAEWNRIQSSGGDPRFQTEADYLQWHDQNYPQENRPSYADPTQPGPTGPAPTGAANPNAGQPNAFQYGPDYGSAPTFAGYDPAVRPDQGSAPGMPDLSGASFEASPGYEYALKEGLRGVNAYFGAKGVLNSGGALEEAIRQGQGMAQQDYRNWQQQQLQAQQQAFNQFAANRANTNTNYDVDTTRGDARTDTARNFDYSQYLDARNYGTGRFDTQNANLTGLVGIGAGATGAVANAGTNYANAFGANNNSAASATGNAAIAGANSVNGLIGNAFNAYGMYAGLRGSPPSSGGTYTGGFASGAPTTSSTNWLGS